MIIFFDGHPTVQKLYKFVDCISGQTAVRRVLRIGSKSVYSDVFNRHELRLWVEMESEDGQKIVSEYGLTR